MNKVNCPLCKRKMDSRWICLKCSIQISIKYIIFEEIKDNNYKIYNPTEK
jgi:hypothetical protein